MEFDSVHGAGCDAVRILTANNQHSRGNFFGNLDGHASPLGDSAIYTTHHQGRPSFSGCCGIRVGGRRDGRGQCHGHPCSVCARWVVPAEHTAATSLVHASRLGDWVCAGIGMVGGAAAGVGSVRATVHGFH